MRSFIKGHNLSVFEEEMYLEYAIQRKPRVYYLNKQKNRTQDEAA